MVLTKVEITKDWLLEQLGSSQDIVFQDIKADKTKVQILYIKSLCDEKKLQEDLIRPFYQSNEQGFESYIQSLPSKQGYQTKEDTLNKIMNGSVVYFFENQIYLFSIQKLINNSISEATVETVIQGPQNAMTENIETNIILVRDRYPQPSLRLEGNHVGKLSQTKITIVYDQNMVNQKVLEDIRNQLSEIEGDVIQAAGQLQRYLSKKKYSLYPTMMITERPDRIVYNLSEGKVVILIDGTPFALIAPAVFYDFMSSMEDVYQSFWISQFIVLLRYIGLFVSLILPAFYIGVTAYNPEFFRVQLALSIAGSRLGVPYPAFLEVLFMLIMMELLTEASIRLPKSIGSTATTVGGLILGQAAVEAGLVSNVMIIIVAAVAISNFVIPINAMTFAMRVTKYLILALAIFFGMVGLVIGFIGLIAYLSSLSSYGQPYLKIFMEPRGSKKGVG